MIIPEEQLRPIRQAEDRSEAVQSLLDDYPSFIEDDALLPYTESAGGIGDDARFQVLGVDEEEGSLTVRVTAFFEEVVWANGCSDTPMPEQRQVDIDFELDLVSGAITHPRPFG